MPAPKPPGEDPPDPGDDDHGGDLAKVFRELEDELDAKPEAPENREPDRP